MTKLIQLNACSGALGRLIVGLVQEHKADILHMQEVTSSPGGKTRYFDLLQNTRNGTDLKHEFFSPTWENMFGNKRVLFGNAILSRFPLNDTFQEFTHGEYKTEFEADVDDYNIRLFQHAVVKINNKDVHLINYHGMHDYAGKLGNGFTDRHCKRIADYMATLNGPKILTGDFNLAPNASSLKTLNDTYRNLCIEHDVQTTRNKFARSMTVVDYIWVSHDVTVNHFEVAPDFVSDHAALILEFDV
jgi:endonuclease/exonuclease/phosphatase family metal-dependent hydrolase